MATAKPAKRGSTKAKIGAVYGQKDFSEQLSEQLATIVDSTSTLMQKMQTELRSRFVSGPPKDKAGNISDEGWKKWEQEQDAGKALLKQLLATTRELRSIQNGKNTDAIRKWLINYNLVMKEMSSQLPWLQSGVQTRGVDKLLEANQKSKDAEKASKHESFQLALKEHEENLLASGTRNVGVLGLASWLGPGAPLIHLLDSIYSLDKIAEKSGKAGRFLLIGAWAKFTKKITDSVKEGTDTAHADAEKIEEQQKDFHQDEKYDKLMEQRGKEEEEKKPEKEKSKKHTGHFSPFHKILGLLGLGEDGLVKKVGLSLLDVGKDLTKKGVELVSSLGGLIFKDGFKLIKDLSGKFLTGAWSLIKNVGGKLIGVLGKGLLSLVGMAADGLGALLSSPVLIGAAIVAAVAGLGYLAWKYRKEIKEFAISTWHKITGFVGTAWSELSSTVEKGWELIQPEVAAVGKMVQDWAGSAWDSIKQGFATALDAVVSAITTFWDSAEKTPVLGPILKIYEQIYSFMWDGVKKIATGAWDKIKEWWGSGKKWVADKLGIATTKTQEAVQEATPVVAKAAGAATQSVTSLVASPETAKKAGSAVQQAITNVGGYTASSLGALSARFESAAGGGGAIGQDSTGGTSYGTYQIASKTGSMQEFLKFLDKAAPDIAKRLRAAGNPNGGKNGTFANAWRAVYAADPKRFNELQDDFAKQQYFDKAVSSIKRDTGVDISKKNKAIQEVLWSTAIQHGVGGATQIFDKALKESGGDDKKLIEDVYAIRSTKFGSSTPQVRAAVQSRFKKEENIALNQLGGNSASATPPTVKYRAKAIQTAKAAAPKSAPSQTTPIQMAASNTVEHVPAYISDEGLLIFNTPGVA